MLTRREFVRSAAAAAGSVSLLQACSFTDSNDKYEKVLSETWPKELLVGAIGTNLRRELVRYATLAPSSHNTQCWKFKIEDNAVTILPDLLRRCPSVDPDDHHLFISMGCASENLVQAAKAHGFRSEARELKTWIRFNEDEAIRNGDGLLSVAAGNPALLTWLGNLVFGLVFKPNSENKKYAKQVRSSSGIAVFTSDASSKKNWTKVGRCYERFALQSTSLGIRNAFLNQPVEVPNSREQFATFLGLRNRRPDLIVRFGRGELMLRSQRRPIEAVIV